VSETRTALGRAVPYGWWDYAHRDLVLSKLAAVRGSADDDRCHGTSLAAVAEMAQIDEANAAAALGALCAAGHVRRWVEDGATLHMATREGVVFAMNAGGPCRYGALRAGEGE
jgi:hypothetical protein